MAGAREMQAKVLVDEAMTRDEFLHEIDAMLELPAGTVQVTAGVKDLPGWDSMQVLSFVLLVQEKLGRVIDGPAVAKAEKVGDLVALVEDLVGP